MIAALFVVPAFLWPVSSNWAQALQAEPDSDPPVPEFEPHPHSVSDRQPIPVRVALVDSGVNYTLPVIASALARDEQGRVIGYDFWDLDDRPFDAHPAPGGRLIRHGTKTASVLIREAPAARLVSYRYPRPDMRRMSELIAHAFEHDVRIIGLPLGGNRVEEWSAFEAAAARHPHMLFIASAGNNGRDIDTEPVYPASLALDNLIVVTSADDYVQPAERVNWGRVSVDYLVPAEQVPVIEFDGSQGFASGSSYAVPRVVALGARLLAANPDWQAPELVAEFRRRYANGAAPRQVSSGFLADPLSVDVADEIRIVEQKPMVLLASAALDRLEPSYTPLRVPLDVLQVSSEWTTDRMMQSLDFAANTLAQCGIEFGEVLLTNAQVPEHLQDLATGTSYSLMQALRRQGPSRRLTVVFARDTRMAVPFDAEAFGRANTRRRSWLQDSVWLTSAIEDEGIALAHEMFHVLANSGEHVSRTGNLMQARTSGDNNALNAPQCLRARENALANSLAG